MVTFHRSPHSVFELVYAMGKNNSIYIYILIIILWETLTIKYSKNGMNNKENMIKLI